MSYLEVRISCDKSPRGGERDVELRGRRGDISDIKGRSSFGRNVARIVLDPKSRERKYEGGRESPNCDACQLRGVR